MVKLAYVAGAEIKKKLNAFVIFLKSISFKILIRGYLRYFAINEKMLLDHYVLCQINRCNINYNMYLLKSFHTIHIRNVN